MNPGERQPAGYSGRVLFGAMFFMILIGIVRDCRGIRAWPIGDGPVHRESTGLDE